MKNAMIFFVVLMISLLASTKRTVAQDDVYVSYQSFYDDLSPYGEWIEDSVHGFVWVPNVDEDFRPYFTDGHWVMTEFGNTWVSDYPWGWACFHYGRWIYNEYYGWIWVPGSEWGPGWVAWRWGNGFCGWTPLYPGVLWVGVGYSCPDDWWIFMHPRYLYKPRYHNVWRSDFMHGPRHTRTILQRTQYVTNTYEHNNVRFHSGPRATQVEQVTHQPVQVYQMGSANVRGPERIINNTVSTFRPMRVEAVAPEGRRLAPSRVNPAPQRVGQPDELNVRWNQPRPYKLHEQRDNPSWQRPFIRNAPPYNNSAGRQPSPQQRNIQVAPRQQIQSVPSRSPSIRQPQQKADPKRR